jgi:uncharacterized surface protein with fasciclin (FAS1) repeats
MTSIRLVLTLLIAAATTACQPAGDAGNDAAAANGQGDSSSGPGGQGARASRTIAETAAQNGDLGQLNRAVEAAGLTETLRGAGPYTVFAPVNAAFERLPEATRNRLLAAEGREQLTELLTYHIVPGVVTSQDLSRAMERGQGRATLSTVSGANITVSREGEALFVTDSGGSRARISQADQIQSNGVIHQIDTILMPGNAPTL